MTTPDVEVKPTPIVEQDIVEQSVPIPEPSLLDGLIVEPEYRGSGYKRYSWRSSVDRALGWKQEGFVNGRTTLLLLPLIA